MEKTLTMMMGLPRSGKSTYASTEGCPVVCPDAIRLALHGQRFATLAEPMVWAVAKIMVRALFLSGHDRVVLDATNTSRKRREEWYSDDWRTSVLVIDTPKEECIRRAREAGDEAIVPVIERMAGQWSLPDDDEPCKLMGIPSRETLDAAHAAVT